MKEEITVTAHFDGTLDAAEVFLKLIAERYKNLAMTEPSDYNKDEVLQSLNRLDCAG